MIDAYSDVFFYVAATIAVLATVCVIAGRNPVHALLNLVVSLLAVAAMFFMLGAPFAGALEIVVYAGAIMVLFVFVVMMLSLGAKTTEQERRWLQPKVWVAPSVLAGALLAGLLYVLLGDGLLTPAALATVDAKAVGVTLFGPYLLAVELASMLLLAALVAAYHLGRHD